MAERREFEMTEGEEAELHADHDPAAMAVVWERLAAKYGFVADCIKGPVHDKGRRAFTADTLPDPEPEGTWHMPMAETPSEE